MAAGFGWFMLSSGQPGGGREPHAGGLLRLAGSSPCANQNGCRRRLSLSIVRDLRTERTARISAQTAVIPAPQITAAPNPSPLAAVSVAFQENATKANASASPQWRSSQRRRVLTSAVYPMPCRLTPRQFRKS